MNELSGEFEDRLKVIDGAGARFWASIGEEKVEIGVGVDEGEKTRERKEIALCQIITDLEKLLEEKRARLKVLTAEYTRIREESVKLAIAILGEEKVTLVESESSKQVSYTTKTTTKLMPSSPSKKVSNVLQDTDATDTATAEEPNESFDQVYDDAEAGLTDLQGTLDELVTRNLEENKGVLKVCFLILRWIRSRWARRVLTDVYHQAFQAGRKVKQGELSKLLNSWSLT